MPFKDPEKRRQAQARYRKSVRGQEKIQQHRLRYSIDQNLRKSGQEFATPLTVSAQDLAAALSNWWRKDGT